MGLDTFICGECHQVFHEIDEFVAHKSNCDGQPEARQSFEQDPSNQTGTQLVEITEINAQETVPQLATTQYIQPVEMFSNQHSTYEQQHSNQQQEGPVTLLMPENAVLMTMDQQGNQAEAGLSSTEDGVVVVTPEELQSLQQQLQGGLQGIVQVEVLQGNINVNNVVDTAEHTDVPQPEDTPELNCHQIELLPVNSDKYASDLKVVVKTPAEILKEKALQEQQLQINGETGYFPKTGKKKGRRKKTEQTAGLTESVEEKKKEDRPPLPEIGPDGRFHCERCKKAFNRERHFKTHRCLTWSDYVNISDRDIDETVDKDGIPTVGIVIESGDSAEKRTVAFKKDISATPNQSTIITDSGIQDSEDISGGLSVPNLQRTRRGRKTKEERLITGEMFSGDSADGKTLMDKPIFTCEDDKIAFDQAMSIDLSFIDHLFTSHTIEQEMNDKAVLGMGRTPTQLTLYTCNECKRVFMSLSQCRLHCLTHTDSKPFRCIKCNFATNTKGNLYTHIRHHTGQIYKCSQCSYTAGNKMHVIEHEETHLGVKHPCKICSKQYATKKSLSNHVRAYHKDEAGKEYLSTFMVRGHRGRSTVLHQCHVCNRKFKKKADRDRHLFFHDIDDIPYIFRCEVCPYATNRRNYLDKHCRKHKVIYVCYLCKKKFISTIRLSEHLNQEHDGLVGPNVPFEEKYSTWKDLFEKCITSSLILPEALKEGIVQVETVQDESTGEVYQHLYVETATENEQVQGNEQEMSSTQETYKDIKHQENPVQEQQGDSSAQTKSGKEDDIFKRLKYKAMTTAELEQLHSVFGQEECEHCGRLFHAADDLQSHSRLHTGERPFRCSQCSYSAITKDNLRRHIEREHELVTYKCTLCDYSTNSQHKLYAHQKTLHNQIPAVCTVCDTKFQDFKVLKAHLNVKHPKLANTEVRKMIFPSTRSQLSIGRRVYKCPYCVKTFLRDYPSFQRHLWIHQGIKPFKCNECSYTCRSKHNLQSHMLRHSNEKPFPCTVCQKRYKSKTALRWHIRGHTFGRQFRCEKCNYQAMQETHLKRHMETHNIIKRYACLLCDFTCNTVNYMKVHYSKLHKGHEYVPSISQSKYMTKVPGQKVYQCMTCSYLFGNTVDLRRHLRIKHGVKNMDMHSLLQNKAAPEVQTEGQVEVVQTVGEVGDKIPVQVSCAQGQITQGSGVLKIESTVGQVLSMDSNIISMADNSQVILQPENYIVTDQTEVIDGSVGEPPRDIIVQYVSEEVINSGNSFPDLVQVHNESEQEVISSVHAIQNLVHNIGEHGQDMLKPNTSIQGLVQMSGNDHQIINSGNTIQSIVQLDDNERIVIDNSNLVSSVVPVCKSEVINNVNSSQSFANVCINEANQNNSFQTLVQINDNIQSVSQSNTMVPVQISHSQGSTTSSGEVNSYFTLGNNKYLTRVVAADGTQYSKNDVVEIAQFSSLSNTPITVSSESGQSTPAGISVDSNQSVIVSQGYTHTQ